MKWKLGTKPAERPHLSDESTLVPFSAPQTKMSHIYNKSDKGIHFTLWSIQGIVIEGFEVSPLSGLIPYLKKTQWNKLCILFICRLASVNSKSMVIYVINHIPDAFKFEGILASFNSLQRKLCLFKIKIKVRMYHDAYSK